jgi:hypothetical protein
MIIWMNSKAAHTGMTDMAMAFNTNGRTMNVIVAKVTRPITAIQSHHARPIPPGRLAQPAQLAHMAQPARLDRLVRKEQPARLVQPARLARLVQKEQPARLVQLARLDRLA